MTQSTIDFLLNNNITIIQVVFAIIFLLVVTVILKSFREEKAQESSPVISSKEKSKEEFLMDEGEDSLPSEAVTKEDGPLDDLDNLDELMAMDQGDSEIQMSAPPGIPSGIPNSGLDEALSEKEKVISDLKNEISLLQEKTKSKGESGELETKVKELSDKLSEYEIIEDDIANLSFYKTENAKLKNELDKLRGGSGTAIEEPAAAPQDIKPPPPPPPKAPSQKSVAPLINPPEQESILNEFEMAVKQKDAIEKNQPPSNSNPISISADSDLLKEFENVVDKELASPEPVKTEAPKTPSPAAAAPSDDINAKKLVEEMEALSKATPPEASDEDDKDNNQKLIEEFENFVNKG
jgi:hypothetical protein